MRAMDGPSQIFDRSLHRVRRERAATTFHSVNFLKKEAAERLAERLEEVTRDFPLAIELGAHQGEFSSCKIDTLIRTDMAEAMQPCVVCDEECLPFAPDCVDLVVSTLSLHWVNDLPGVLIQAGHILKPDGLFLAVLPGARTLQELRAVLSDAEMELTGGMGAHISPYVEVRDAGNLLMRAGFALPMADSETITVSYDTMFSLLKDLRMMGESNALVQHAHYLRRDVLMRAAELYQERYRDEEGRVTATVELVFLTGWKPHPSQPKPAQRGSGQVSFIDALQTPSDN